jgi:hypothetical protein
MSTKPQTRWAFVRIQRPPPVSVRGGFASVNRSPETVMLQVHPSLTFRSYRVPSLVNSRPVSYVRSFELRALPTRGSGPLARLTLLGPRSRGISQSRRYVPLTGFLNLSAVCSPASFTGLFHPIDHVQGSFTPSRDFSLRAVFLPHRKALPPCRCRDSTHRPKPAAMSSRLDFEASVHAEQRSLRFGVSLTVSRSPQRVSVSSRFSPSSSLAPVTG